MPGEGFTVQSYTLKNSFATFGRICRSYLAAAGGGQNERTEASTVADSLTRVYNLSETTSLDNLADLMRGNRSGRHSGRSCRRHRPARHQRRRPKTKQPKAVG